MVKVNCFAQEHNTMSPPGFQPRLFDQGVEALTMTPLCLNPLVSHAQE